MSERCRDSDLRSNRCCVCRYREGVDTSSLIELQPTQELPGSGWRCIDRDACRARVHAIVSAHRELAAIMNPKG